MKKIMMAVVAATCVAVVNAATVTWSATATSTTLSDGNVANGVYAYLFEGTLSQDTLAAIANHTWDQSGTLATVNATSSGVIAKAGIGNYKEQTVDFSMILLNAANYASATEFKYAEVKDVTFVSSNKPVQFATPLTAAQWTEIAPEPTSGLMMLLGMGVLALRRRRA